MAKGIANRITKTGANEIINRIANILAIYLYVYKYTSCWNTLLSDLFSEESKFWNFLDQITGMSNCKN